MVTHKQFGSVRLAFLGYKNVTCNVEVLEGGVRVTVAKMASKESVKTGVP